VHLHVFMQVRPSYTQQDSCACKEEISLRKSKVIEIPPPWTLK